MKTMKKVLVVLLAMSLVASCMTGCGNKKVNKNGNSKQIEIAYWNSGLGEDWLKAMIEAFEAKYPEYDVEYTASASISAINAPFGHPETDTIDLYMGQEMTLTSWTESLNDVLDSTADGDTKTIREKIDPSYLELESTAEGDVYQLTYGGGIAGFIYNKDLFAKAGITQLPRTSNELASVCDALASEDITPICHFAGTGYWEYINELWYCQYEGMDYYKNNFYGCTDENGNSPSKEIFTKKDGRYEVMKACEKIVRPEYVLNGSNSNDHIFMQTEFLYEKCAMMISGAWMINEMKGIGKVDSFSILRTPVISSITDKLTTVKKETELRKVIDAVDLVTDGTKDIAEYQDGENYKVDDLSVSAADWDYIRAARNSTATNYSGEGMFIPNYSDAKEGAKEFIKFMYSDEGYRIYLDTLHIPLPLSLCEEEIDATGWNAFETALMEEVMKSEQTVTSQMMNKHRIFINGGATMFAGYNFINKLCSNNKSDRVTADQAWENMQKKIENDYENNWLANIGE